MVEGLQSSAQLPVDLLDGCRIECLINGGSIFSLPAILDHSSHALLIEGAFKKNGIGVLDQLCEGLLETITGEMGCSDKQEEVRPSLSTLHTVLKRSFLPPEKIHFISHKVFGSLKLSLQDLINETVLVYP